MGVDFAVHLGLGAVFTKKLLPRAQNCFQGGIGVQTSSLRSLSTRPETWRHRSVSCRRVFMPAFVMAEIPGIAIAFGLAPGSFDAALLFQADEGGVERSLIQVEGLIGDLEETGRDGVGVLRPHGGEGSENDQVECTLQDLHAFTWHSSGD